MKKLKSVKEGKNAVEKISKHQNEQELSIRELLEVQGGLDMEEFMRDCVYYQCKSAASVSCDDHAV